MQMRSCRLESLRALSSAALWIQLKVLFDEYLYISSSVDIQRETTGIQTWKQMPPDLLSLTRFHLSHESSRVCHPFAQIYDACFVLLHSAHHSCCKRPLMVPICLTGFLHTFSGFLSWSNTTHHLHQSWSQKSCSPHCQPACCHG